jgi:hypothetical protein
VYGHVLPNSALYKSGRGITFEVLERFVSQAAPVLVVAGLALLLTRGRTRLLAVPVLVYAAGSVGMLDSVNSYSRLFLPVWPLLALLAGVTVAVAHRRLGRHGAAVAVGLALLLTAHGALTASEVVAFSRHYAGCNEAARAGAAAWLRTRTAPETVYSISDAGLVPLRAGDRTAVDQLRLNEAQLQVAGRRPLPEEIDQVYDARPDVLVLASTDPERLAGRYAADRTMAADPRFRGYSLAHVARGGGADCRYHLFVHRLRALP